MNFFTKRKIVFLTGTRADFGKLKSLMVMLQEDDQFEVNVFVTGMHMLSKYGATWEEVLKAGLTNRYHFINQNENDSMDHILAKTVSGFSDYVKEARPDLIVVHGDRLEALAGAIVGAFNNIRVAHIEGGEISGTIDEIIRHSVSKMSHLHFVANESARRRLLQLGEHEEAIHVIGSPDIDLMNSDALPSLREVENYYELPFSEYGILIFHPVTTERDQVLSQTSVVIDAVLASGENFVVLFPNNDPGSDVILREYERFQGVDRIALFPSMRFEYFLTLLKNARFILGNSSAGVREAPHYGIPTINLGSRQLNRVFTPSVINVPLSKDRITEAISQALTQSIEPVELFGSGNSSKEFQRVLMDPKTWAIDIQKYFNDYI